MKKTEVVEAYLLLFSASALGGY